MSAHASFPWCPSCGGSSTTGGFAHAPGCKLVAPLVPSLVGPHPLPARFTLPEVADLLERALGPSDAVCWLRKEAGRG